MDPQVFASRKRRVIAGGFAVGVGGEFNFNRRDKRYHVTISRTGASVEGEMAANGRAINRGHAENGSGGERFFPIVQMEAREDGFYFENERHAAVGWICRRVRFNASVRSSIVVWIRSNALRWVKAGKVQIL